MPIAASARERARVLFDIPIVLVCYSLYSDEFFVVLRSAIMCVSARFWAEHFLRAQLYGRLSRRNCLPLPCAWLELSSVMI